MSSSYTFNNMGRIGSDTVDNSQQNLYNTRFSDYLLANYHGENNSIDTQVKFASQQPTFVATGIATGTGFSLDKFTLLRSLIFSPCCSFDSIIVSQDPLPK